MYKRQVYIVSAEADDGNGLEILANAGLENGENYFITQRFLHYTEAVSYTHLAMSEKNPK